MKQLWPCIGSTLGRYTFFRLCTHVNYRDSRHAFAAVRQSPPNPGDLPSFLSVQQSLWRAPQTCHHPNRHAVTPRDVGSWRHCSHLMVLKTMLQFNHGNETCRNRSYITQSRQDCIKVLTGMKDRAVRTTQQHRPNKCSS